MKKSKKEKIKKFLKEKWYVAGGSVLLLALAITAMLIGFYMTGWSIIDWLKSPYAVTFFVILIVGGLALFALFITYKRYKLGGRDDE